MEIEKRKRNLDMGIITLFIHWVVGTGALVLPIILGVLISKAWLPVVVLLEVVTLYYYIQTAAVQSARCYLILNVCARALLLSAAVMIAINYCFSSGWIYRLYDPAALNDRIPYVCVLIICPCTAFFAGLAAVRGQRQSFCRYCVMRYGNASERGFIGYIYKREGHLQAVILFWMAAFISAYSWVYYLLAYINVNYNRPDYFFFIIVPVGFYIASLIYCAIRYSGLLSYYSMEVVGSARQRGAITQMRYILIRDDSVFITPIDPSLSNTRLDTPFSITVRYRSKPSETEALEYFRNMSHLEEVDIKYLYTSESGNLDGTICHYAAIIPKDAEMDTSLYPLGRWVTFYELKWLAINHKLAPLLSAEVNRIYTITMAWKTYDRNGRRLYKIKNYRPGFRLSQLADLDVDYNDNRWLFVAANNEDRPFFRLRRMVKKVMFGRDI